MTKNILFVTENDDFYGATRSLISLLEGLQDYDIKPFVVVSKESGFTNSLSDLNIPFRITPIPRWVTPRVLSNKEKRKFLKRIYQSCKHIREMAQSWRIDIIYTNSSVTPVGRLVSLFECLPHIWHIREFGDLDFSLKFIFPKSMSKFFLNSSDAIICNSKAVRDHRFKKNSKRVHMVHNGSASKAQFEERLERRQEIQKHNDFVFAMVSKIMPHKGQEVAIRGLAELNKRGCKGKLLIAGNGEKSYEDVLKQLARDLNITDLVEFTGSVNDPFKIYYSSDCVLICSDYEALSRVGLEAMSTALPLIGKNSGGTPEIIEHEKTGLLYSTFEQLVDNMERLVKDPDLGRKMGLHGWMLAKERFTIEKYSKSIYEIIDSV